VSTEAPVTISVRDLQQVRLFMVELRALCERMVARDLPEAEELNKIVHRFLDTNLHDDRP